MLYHRSFITHAVMPFADYIAMIRSSPISYRFSKLHIIIAGKFLNSVRKSDKVAKSDKVVRSDAGRIGSLCWA